MMEDKNKPVATFDGFDSESLKPVFTLIGRLNAGDKLCVCAPAQAAAPSDLQQLKAQVRYWMLRAAEAEQALEAANAAAAIAPQGWRGVIGNIREHIGAGAYAEQAQHERSVIEPYLDTIADELDALEVSQGAAPTAADVRDAEYYRLLRDFGDEGKPAVFIAGRWYGAKLGNGVGFDLDAAMEAKRAAQPNIQEAGNA